MNESLRLFLLFLSLLCSHLSAIKCYAGSRGYVNKELMELYNEETCDPGMKYCIESFSRDFVDVTMSCQRLGTNPDLLDICKRGKPETKGEVTIRCCIEDLCNSKGIISKSFDSFNKTLAP